MRVLRLSVLSVLVVVASATSTTAETIRVPADALTIQAGIDAAFYGDVVLVAPGVYDDYTEHEIYDFGWETVPLVAYLKDGVRVISESGPQATRIVGHVASGASTVYGQDLGPDTEFSGFTVVNIPWPRSAITLYNCTGMLIESCIIDSSGSSGVMCRSASPVISHNWIFRCPNDCIRIYDMSAPYVVGNVIGWSGDDGIENDPPGSPTIIGNTFVFCGTTPGNPSQAIDTGGQNLLIQRNIIAWNEAAFWAPEGCTLVENDIYANGGQNSYAGNISEDPLFCDMELPDFRIMAGSPCAPGNNAWGILIGAGEVGCETSVRAATWGAIKAMYR